MFSAEFFVVEMFKSLVPTVFSVIENIVKVQSGLVEI